MLKALALMDGQAAFYLFEGIDTEFPGSDLNNAIAGASFMVT
jgi:hypothetical protein